MSEAATFADLVAAGVLSIGDGYRAKLNELGTGGPLFLRAGALTDAGFTWMGLEEFNDDAPVHSKIGRAGDVVITTKGNSTGRVGWVPADAPSFVYSPHLSYWRSLDDKVVQPRFLYYWSRGREFERQLRNFAHGTDMAPYLSLRDQLRLRVTLPDTNEQVRIADVLGALDDKIAANTKLASAADEYLRTLIDSSSGTETIRIGDLFSSPRATVNPELVDPTTPYVGLEHVARRSIWLGESGSASEVNSGKSRFAAGDVLFGKLRPYFHKVVTAPFAGICSTDILVLRPHDRALAGFATVAVASDAVVAAVTSSSEGTRMPRASWKDLAAVEIAWPGHEAAAALSAHIDDILRSILTVLAENLTLAAIRDTLLPQLMSGKLRVRDLEGQPS